MLKCIVVDAYSAANLFASELRNRGHIPIHVQSDFNIPDGYKTSFRSNDFAKNIVFSGDSELLLSQINGERPFCSIAGAESGVVLNDFITTKLNLRTNGIEYSFARRNKFLMGEILKQNNICAPYQLLSSDFEEILLWATTKNIFPIVLKPNESAGSDNIHFCFNKSQLKEAFESIILKKNKLNIINEQVLAQQLLTGNEYAVNSVSLDGKHFISSIWQYKKLKLINHGATFYDYDDLIEYGSAEEIGLPAYARIVLDALHIQNGPAHLEIMNDGVNSVLIEAAARISGATMPAVDMECIGYGQIDLTVDAYLNPKDFCKKTSQNYKLKKHARLVTLISNQLGTVADSPGIKLIEKLPSFHSARIKLKTGDKTSLTKDIFTSPGFILLTNKDKQILEEDYHRIRAIEQKGIFELYD